MHSIKPADYAANRNYVDGPVTYLGPYISRGVISTRDIFEHIRSLDLPWVHTEKLIQELAWRDYWQQVWIAKGDGIHKDLKYRQEPVSNYQVPLAVLQAKTGIQAVDEAIRSLYETGYMHNHMRMYVASICTNIANSHWLQPAQWMYAHLLDGDLASNHLSWQWVAGANSSKKYYANQDNINKYSRSQQKNTFLDVAYEQFANFVIPGVLTESLPFELKTTLPTFDPPILKKDKITLIYNYYNLDPTWRQEQDVQRVLLLEPSHFLKHPVSQKGMNFMLDLAKHIQGLQVFVGEFQALQKQLGPELVFKEHPLNRHYRGHEDSRDWLSSVTGYFPSFFAFWKKCRKELKP